MDTEEREQHKLKLIKTILTSSSYDMKELLSIYAFYLSSAPDTLYNISYYTDRIDDFMKNVNDLPKKIKTFDDIIKKIKSEISSHPQRNKFTFIFDDLFFYNKFKLDIKKEKVDLFRLDLVNPNKFSLRIRIESNDEDNDLFIEYYSEDSFKDIKAVTNKIKESILKHYPLPKKS